MSTLTRHGRDRMKQRMGLSLAAAARLTEMAREKGITVEETAGALRRFLDERMHTHGGHYRIYAQHLFVFDGDALVTTLKVPNRFKATVEKIKSARKEPAA